MIDEYEIEAFWIGALIGAIMMQIAWIVYNQLKDSEDKAKQEDNQ